MKRLAWWWLRRYCQHLRTRPVPGLHAVRCQYCGELLRVQA